MSQWLHILIDISVLSFLGFLYYIWQKRKIIRLSLEDIWIDLENFRFDLHKYTEENNQNKELVLFTEEFEAAFQAQKIEQIIILEKNTAVLSSALSQYFDQLCHQIKDHLSAV